MTNMANEEQRRAFASYMGTAGATQGHQSVPQYPGAIATPGNPYLYNQFPGLGVPPAAPTPPPAAPSSIASFPGYQGSFPQAGFGQGGYDQNGLAQRPPPLGQAEAPNGQPQILSTGTLTGVRQGLQSYNAQPPLPPGYSPSWQYAGQAAELARRRSGAPQRAMVLSSRTGTGELLHSRSKQTNEQFHYHHYGQAQAPPASPVPPPEVEEVSVPVMLCHTCSECGKMRSTGFHRNNPVVPGKPLVSTPCRRCRKMAKSHRQSRSSYTHIRSCTANKPCEWPRESVQIDIEHRERRGRRRSREEVYATRYSPSRPRVVEQSSSRAHLGLRVLQQPRRDLRTERTIRVSSLSPRRSSRYDEIWPPPDIVRTRASRFDENSPLASPEAPRGQNSMTDEVWPPPDIVRTHSYRKIESPPPLRRTSSRIIELSPSPPLSRTRSTRVVYRDESQEQRISSRSVSPARVSFREEQQSEGAEARITAHPRPYRSVVASSQPLRKASDEKNDYMKTVSRRSPDSPSRSILKTSGVEYETSYRRQTNMRDSPQSTYVEVERPRVHFGQDRHVSEPVPERSRKIYEEDRLPKTDDFEQYHDYSKHRYVVKAPPSPLSEDFDRLRIRRSPMSSSRVYEDEIRIDRARRISPSPPPQKRSEKVRVRYTSPIPPSKHTRPMQSPPSPGRPAYSGYRHVTRTAAVERPRPLTSPPAKPHDKEEDHTDSGSALSDEVTEVRSWRGLDEDGKPARFVEEHRAVRMIEQDNERGSDFDPMGNKLASRCWRNV